MQANAQVAPVSGRITNDKGEPLAGVTVSVLGKSISATTQEDGRFTINASPKDALVITSVGYETAEVVVTAKTSLSITLTTKAATMNEVVVVGYGTQNRRDLTGSVAKIDNKVLSAVPVSSFDAALRRKWLSCRRLTPV